MTWTKYGLSFGLSFALSFVLGFWLSGKGERMTAAENHRGYFLRKEGQRASERALKKAWNAADASVRRLGGCITSEYLAWLALSTKVGSKVPVRVAANAGTYKVVTHSDPYTYDGARKTANAKVLAKYPHVVVTTLGHTTWTEIAMLQGIKIGRWQQREERRAGKWG